MDKKQNTLALAMGTGVAFAVTLLPLLGLPAMAGPRIKPGPTPTPTVSATPTTSATVSPTPTASPTSTPTSSSTPTTTQGTPVTKGVNLNITITAWNGGATADVVVTNSTSAAINGWKVDLPWQVAPTSIWSGVSTSTPGHVIVSQEAWNGTLAAGATTSFGMTYIYSSPPANPSTCTATATSLATDCAVASVTWTPVTATSSPSVTATPSSSPSATVTIPAAAGVANYKLAPYIDMAAYPTPDLVATRTASGQNVYSLGFVTAAAACQPAWGGYPTLAVGATGGQIGSIDASIGGVRSVGGDVIVSFGGAVGTELARTCTDVTLLKNAYRAVVDRYALRAIDLDIEGSAQTDHTANVRRSQALAALQSDLAAVGRTLRISLTLPVLSTGLTSTGLGVVQDTIVGKARIDLVNVMAMDYGGSNNAMGQSAVNAGMATAKQMSVLWPSLTDTQRLANIGVTPMIGQNDIANEVFTVADATTLTTWARNSGLGQISWWQVLRDTPCAGNALVLSTTCSGTTAAAWSYSTEFRKR